MAANISKTSKPTSPSRDQSTTTPASTSSLSAELDKLLETYLELLDTYTTLREQLSREFSSGFLSIAQANRNSTLGAGRRYGEENYDERMKAGRHVQIQPIENPSHGQRRQEDPKGQHKGAETQQKNAKEDVTERNEEAHKPSHDTTTSETETFHFAIVQSSNVQKPSFTSDSEKVSNAQPETISEDIRPGSLSPASPLDTPSTSEPSTQSSTKTAPDPLKWFGIFTPPSLRNAQTSFISAVTNTVPSLLNTASDMRALEDQIWAVRKKMGILDEYNYKWVFDEVGVLSLSSDQASKDNLERKSGEEMVSSMGLPLLEPETRQNMRPSAASPSRKQNLVSRAGGPRSRVLKVD